ncbi:hypothetical protein PPYR_06728 [Photinus pyralis]|uniref:Uncharacterized protein n=1 Tax=Photinus pyralis TaxID=7054 RepID=A0A1Y1K9E1_PHOPY|nr:hypothetical protein PPYR_06728 [Photinus pyralis]
MQVLQIFFFLILYHADVVSYPLSGPSKRMFVGKSSRNLASRGYWEHCLFHFSEDRPFQFEFIQHFTKQQPITVLNEKLHLTDKNIHLRELTGIYYFENF